MDCHRALSSFRPSRELRLLFIGGTHLRAERFDVTADLSLSEFASVASEKWNLVDVKTEFEIVEEGSDRAIAVEKTKLIGDLSLEGKELYLKTSADQIAIQFQVGDGSGRRFVVGFSEGDTVGNAKFKVANYLGARIETTRIWLSGNELRDVLALKDIGIGGQPLTISFVDTSAGFRKGYVGRAKPAP